MSAKPYTPRPGSVPAQVVAELQRLGEGHGLTVSAVMALTGAGRTSIDNCLATALQHGVLRAGTDEAGHKTYTLGDGTPASTPGTAAPRAAKPPKTPKSAKTPREPELEALTLSHWGDGDVTCSGMQLSEEGVAIFKPGQIRQLLAFVTQPAVPIAALAWPRIQPPAQEP